MSEPVYIKVHWINTDGSRQVTQELELPTLTEMQEHVGGYIEVVSVLYQNQHCHMIVNENGHALDLPYNPLATDIYHTATVKPACELKGKPYRATDWPPILGDVILIEGRLE